MPSINFITLLVLLFTFGCSTRVDEVTKSDQISGQVQPEKKQIAKPDLINLLKKRNNNQLNSKEDTSRLVFELKKNYVVSSNIREKSDLLMAIAGLDKVNTTGFFIKALAEPEPQIRREAAIQMKAMVVNPDVLDALVIALDDKNDEVLIEVIEAVSDRNDKRVLDKLNKIADSHPEQIIREVAMDYANRMENLP